MEPTERDRELARKILSHLNTHICVNYIESADDGELQDVVVEFAAKSEQSLASLLAEARGDVPGLCPRCGKGEPALCADCIEELPLKHRDDTTSSSLAAVIENIVTEFREDNPSYWTSAKQAELYQTITRHLAPVIEGVREPIDLMVLWDKAENEDWEKYTHFQRMDICRAAFASARAALALLDGKEEKHGD